MEGTRKDTPIASASASTTADIKKESVSVPLHHESPVESSAASNTTNHDKNVDAITTPSTKSPVGRKRSSHSTTPKTATTPVSLTPKPRKKRKPPAGDSFPPSPTPDDLASPLSPPAPLHPHVELSGVYAPLLRLRKKRELDTMPVFPLPPRVIGGLRDQIEKLKQCNCKRSNCLKLYCDCFQSGLHCNATCNCVTCRNTAQFTKERNHAVEITLFRNPHAFRPRMLAFAGAVEHNLTTANVTSSTTITPTKPKQASLSSTPTLTPTKHQGLLGCNCKKSFCLKKYCECFHAAVYCSSPHCRCTDCQNIEGNPERERLVAKRRSQAEAVAAAAALAHQHSRLSGRMGMMGDAGRAYYEASGASHMTTHHVKVENQDVEASTAAAAVAAGAAAGGVDVFLPPSSYTIPMKLPDSSGGATYAGLAFGTAGPQKISLPPSTSSSNISTTTTGKINVHRPSSKAPLSSGDGGKKLETELQRSWRIEIERVKATFELVQQQLRQRNGIPEEAQVGYISNKEEPERVVESRARKTMDSIETDLQRLVAAVEQAEQRTIRYLDNMDAEHNQQDVKQLKKNEDEIPRERILNEVSVRLSKSNEGLDNDLSLQCNEEFETPAMDLANDNKHEKAMPRNLINGLLTDTTKVDASSLLRFDGINKGAEQTIQAQIGSSTDTSKVESASLMCHEQINDVVGKPLSDYAVRELTILVAQDAALLRELAYTIRRKTLEMTEQRIRLITNAKPR